MQNVEASQVVHTDPPDGWQDMSSWIVGQRTFSLVFVFDRGSNRVSGPFVLHFLHTEPHHVAGLARKEEARIWCRPVGFIAYEVAVYR